MEYTEFLDSKNIRYLSKGKTISIDDIHPSLFPFQKDVTKWAVSKGRCAVFLSTGLGKTRIQLEFARLMNENTLIIAPLSVARQTVREGQKINVEVKYVREQSEIGSKGIYITNYEMLDKFNYSKFGTVVLDESSILKSISSKTRAKLIEACQQVPYRLCCTATPAPNDFIEIGNHAEFLGVCTRAEMLAMFFINANKEHTFRDGNSFYRKKGMNKDGTEWRLRHHAEKPFFRWLASWAFSMVKPSDLGYDDNGFILPKLNYNLHIVEVDYQPEKEMFFAYLKGIQDRAKIRDFTVEHRLAKVNDILSTDNGQWIIWCGLDKESKALSNAIEGSIEVEGSDSPDYKAQMFEDFQDGKYKVLVTKSKIGGFGLNFQNANNMIFFGLNDSWETFFQSVRREWRFGQDRPVNVHIIISSLETEIYNNIMRKDIMAERLINGLINEIKEYEKDELAAVTYSRSTYKEDTVTGKNWTAMLGDSCTRLKEIPDESIDMSVYSPPFAELFTYTDSDRDLGNCKGREEFINHYSFIIKEMLRVTKSGRLSCVHTSDIPAMLTRDGYIGIKDFPGDVIRAHEKEGWVFYGRALISKNPQSQAVRTKSKALLFVQLAKDSSCSRPALVDHVLIFQKPGDNKVPITPVRNGDMDNELWIQWANGVWMDISESDTLSFYEARDSEDEKHVCPLQLGTIERCIKLYSNPGETVLTPFMGVGSEAYQALNFGRKTIGIELKESYFNTAVNNLKHLESSLKRKIC